MDWASTAAEPSRVDDRTIEDACDRLGTRLAELAPYRTDCTLTALTQEQVEVLRRAHDGASLAQTPFIPHPLDEVGLLRRLDLVAVDLDGNVNLTPRGVRCLDAAVMEREQSVPDLFEPPNSSAMPAGINAWTERKK